MKNEDVMKTKLKIKMEKKEDPPSSSSSSSSATATAVVGSSDVGQEDSSSPQQRLDIILARFSEDLTDFFDLLIVSLPDWIAKQHLQVQVFIYNKGPTDPLQGYDTKKTFQQSSVAIKKFFRDHIHISSLDNVGREGHTFLHHIITHYDHIADLNAFLPASCMTIHKISSTKRLLDKLLLTKSSVFQGPWYPKPIHQTLSTFQINAWEGTTGSNKAHMPTMQCLPAKIRPFGKWFQSVFPDKPVVHAVCYTSVFAVHRDHIIQNTIPHYERVIQEVNQHSNPEAGHFLERSWLAVFYPLPDACIYAARPVTEATPVLTTAPRLIKKTFAQMKEEQKLKLAAKQAMKASASTASDNTVPSPSTVVVKGKRSIDEVEDGSDHEESNKRKKVDSI